jgi:hypothetical protein
MIEIVLRVPRVYLGDLLEAGKWYLADGGMYLAVRSKLGGGEYAGRLDTPEGHLAPGEFDCVLGPLPEIKELDPS